MTCTRQQLLSRQVAWMAVGLVALVALDVFSLETFFLISVAGFAFLTELSTSTVARPGWTRRLWFLIVVCLLGYLGLIASRLLA